MAKMEVQGKEITVFSKDQDDFICITDIARYKNADRANELIRNWLRNRNTIEFLGINNVIDLDIRMTAEDFAYFSHMASSVFYRIGTGNTQKNIVSPLHSPTFDIDEEVLRFAPGLLANAAISFLK